MIVEERMYTLHVGKVGEFLEVFEHEGMPMLRKHFGNLLGVFVNQIGVQNVFVQLWAFDSYEDRERRRAALDSEPTFAAFRKKVFPLIQAQENRLMRAPAFFEPTMITMLKAGNGL